MKKGCEEMEYLTAKEVSEKFRIHLNTVYVLTKEGKLPAVKLGGSYRYDLDKLQEHFGGDNAETKNK